jgi:uncharacterized protein
MGIEVMAARSIAVLVLAVLVLAGCGPEQAGEPSPAAQRTIAVSASAVASRPYDIGVIEIEVAQTAASPAEATRRTSDIMTRVIKSLKNGGVAGPDMRTSEVDTQPSRICRTRSAGQRDCTLVSLAENRLLAHVRGRDHIAGLSLGAAGAGAEMIGWQQDWGFSNPDEWFREARERALALAQQKADDYAAALGVKLGQVLSITSTPDLLPSSRFVYPHGGVPDQPDARDGQPLNPDRQAAGAAVFVVYAIE